MKKGERMETISWCTVGLGGRGQPILQIKMIDEFLMSWSPTLEHSTFINSLTELLKKKKMKFVKNTHDTHTIASTNRVPKDHLPSRLQRSRGRQRLWQGSNLRLMWMNPCLNYPSPLISYINQLAGSHPSLLQVCPQMSGHWSVLQLECTRSWQLYCTFKN